ncbi:hypothetical protein ABZ599_32755 [Streptomyces misionensis]|uniref:hypothetical protein n=1 Tax=Streptomyces misionensis TaxID=67331 RepID=UPI0033C4F71B
MHLVPSPATDIHETLIILPGGGIHAQGLLYDGPPDHSEALIERVRGPLRAVAARHNRPIRLSIGHPDGHVEYQQIAADGTVHPAQAPPTDTPAADPVWKQGIPEHTGLLAATRAAQRVGQWRAAQEATRRATQHLITQYGRDHPYVAMGTELQAYFAAMSQDLAAAASLYAEAAVAIHRLGGPHAQSHRNLASAVTAWLHSDRDTSPGGAGFAAAHALIRITPSNHATLKALLRRLCWLQDAGIGGPAGPGGVAAAGGASGAGGSPRPLGAVTATPGSPRTCEVEGSGRILLRRTSIVDARVRRVGVAAAPGPSRP